MNLDCRIGHLGDHANSRDSVTSVRAPRLHIGCEHELGLLVAECDGDELLEVHQERAFNRIGRELRVAGVLPEEKIAEVASEVRDQLRAGARDAAVATAAIRRAAKRWRARGGDPRRLRPSMCSIRERRPSPCLGAALDHEPAGTVGVVDVGGGSSELVVGV